MTEKKFLNGRCILCGGTFGCKGCVKHPVSPKTHLLAIRIKLDPDKSDLDRNHMCGGCYRKVSVMSDKNGNILPEFDPYSTPPPKKKAQSVPENLTVYDWTETLNLLKAKEIKDLINKFNHDPIELEPGYLNKVIDRVEQMCPQNFESITLNITPDGNAKGPKALKARKLRIRLFATVQILQQCSCKTQDSITVHCKTPAQSNNS
jgi:hypothetical protein